MVYFSASSLQAVVTVIISYLIIQLSLPKTPRNEDYFSETCRDTELPPLDTTIVGDTELCHEIPPYPVFIDRRSK